MTSDDSRLLFGQQMQSQPASCWRASSYKPVREPVGSCKQSLPGMEQRKSQVCTATQPPIRQIWLLSCALLLSCSQLAHSAGVDDLLSGFGWQEPHVKQGQDVFGPKEGVELPTCTNLNVTVLDLGAFAHTLGLHPCSMLHVGDHAELVKSPYSGPLQLMEAIQSSQYYTSEPEKADIVFVNDYCYYASGEAFRLESNVTEGGRVMVRGPNMVDAYQALLQSPRWQRHMGADFVFYDSHAGFGVNGSGIPIDDLICSDFRNATFLTTDRTLRLETCHSQSLEPLPRSRMMVVPTVPHRLDPGRPDMHLSRQPLPLEERNILVNCRALCPDDDPVPPGFNEWGSSFSVEGYMMRTLLEPIVADPEDQVDCTRYEYLATPKDAKLGGGKITHFDQTYAALERSIFCLFLPGATGMGYRFSEAMMAGCIPVFVGPPFPPLPLVDEVRYTAAAVFININEQSGWQKDAEENELFKAFAEQFPTLGERWSPSVSETLEPGVAERAIQLRSLENLPVVLQAMSAEEIERKLHQLSEIRSKFAFDTEITHVPNAANVILSGMCRRAGRGCSRSYLKREGGDAAIRERCRRAGVAAE